MAEQNAAVTYDIGTKVECVVTFRDRAEQLTDPTNVTLEVDTPSNTRTSKTYPTDPEVVRESVGVYYMAVLPTVNGRFDFRGVGTGALVAATEGSFMVRKRRVEA